MKKFLLAVMALSASVLAAEGSLSDRVDGLQAQFDRVMAKAGIQFGGEFRSQYLGSTLSGDAVGDGKKNENVEYTSVDFDIVARPNTALSARAMFRMHQDWRNFFSDVQNPITTRWLSIDGSILNGIVKYNVGDYHKKLTPLTLWSPDLEFLYEPEIFAENRKLAMSESFVGGNNRALQGANIEFKAELYPIVHEVSADVFAARLAARGTGESGVVSPGVASAPDGQYWDAPYDKYLLGFNLASQILDGAGFGVSNIMIFDHLNSYREDSTAAKLNSQNTNIFAARAGVSTRAFMDSELFDIGIDGEAAFSSGKDYFLYSDPVDPENPIENPIVNELRDRVVDEGMAINAGLNARVSIGEANVIRLSADFIMNDSAFRNDAAQSPTFIQRSIMNNENGMSGLGLLNPFDALYRSVFKYAPSQYFGGAKPFTKNAYMNSILSKEQNATIAGSDRFAYPSVFQMALPGGMATSDRVGVVASLCGSFLDKGVTVGAKFAWLNTKEEYDLIVNNNIERGTPEFMEMVGGASVDIAKFAPVVGPSLELGGSYGMYNAKAGDEERTNDLLTWFLNYRFHPRFALMFGYQSLASTEPARVVGNIEDGQRVTTKYDYTFSNLSFGLNYRVAEGGFITFKLSVLSGDLEGSRVVETADLMGGGDVLRETFHDNLGYTAMQPEVYLTVRF